MLATRPCAAWWAPKPERHAQREQGEITGERRAARPADHAAGRQIQEHMHAQPRRYVALDPRHEGEKVALRVFGPTTSRNLATNSGSVDPVKYATWCGFSPLARHNREMVA